MAEVTEADRENAREIILVGDSGPESWTQVIAAALAEEREKARAPFLAVAASCDDAASLLGDGGEGAAAYRIVSRQIRRAAEETP